MLLLLIGLGVLGPHLPIGEATRIAAGPRLSPPSWRFPFGTDELGRSFLPRVVLGIRATFLLSAVAVAMTACLGALLGMTAGYFRGATDQIVARAADVLFSFPALLIGLLIAAAAGPGETFGRRRHRRGGAAAVRARRALRHARFVRPRLHRRG